jgi:hypothetical protein
MRFLRLLGLVVLLCPLADAQQAANDQDEMRFVESMRKQGYSDLALQYLEKLKAGKGISDDLRAQLPVEIARTQLESAGDEPDIGRRLALYGDVRTELQKYLKANPTSPRAGEIELDIAEVAVMQGRLTLSQAVMLDESDSHETPERLKARALLKDAGAQLIALDKKLKDQLKALPEPKTEADKAERARLERTEYQARFNIAMNYFDQAQTYPGHHPKSEVLLERGKRIEECRKELESLVGLDGTNPATASIKWRAMAWLGRCFHELGEPVKARARYAEVIAAAGPLSFDGVRLAQYFRLLVIDEKAEAGEDRSKLIQEGCDKWLKAYPRLTNSPEGCGVRWLVAKNTLERAAATKDAKEKSALLVQARRLLTGLESTENDFSDRARRRKIQIIGEQGTFTKKVAELTTFEDCYVRAQYEQYELEKDADTFKDNKTQLEAKRKERTETIMAALAAGLEKPDAKTKTHLTEANNARTMLCYYYLNDKKYPECIKFGETFAREDPRSSQAVKCAAYALQAHSMLAIANKGDPQKMAEFAKYCKERWKKELPGDLARHQLALAYLADKKQDEAIAELDEITPSYPAYAATQLLLAEEASKIIRSEPDRADVFKKKLVAALERVPESAKGKPLDNQAYYLIRCKLADEMYNNKQYDRTEAIATALDKDLKSTMFEADPKKDEEMRGYFAARIAMSFAYARYGRAKLAMEKSDFPKVSAQLDPVVDLVLGKKLDALKTNPNLANAIFDMDLKANIQQGKLDRTKLTVQALQALNEDAGGDVPPILKQLVPLIRQQVDEIKKKGDEAGLKKAKDGFSAILDELTKKQEKVNPEFQIVLAQAYNNMTVYDKAAELLRKIPAPPAEADEKSPEVKHYRAAQIFLVRTLRAAKDYPGAEEALKGVMGEPKTGWGRKNVDALKERIGLSIDQDDFNTAFAVATQLGKALSRPADTDPRMKEQYIDVYYSMVYSLVRQSSKQKEDAKKKKGMDDSARFVIDLEKRFPDLGGDASEKRFRELVDGDPDLKKSYEALKPKK